ncbi:ABC transporter permease [Rhizobium sp. C4]|uniref:ABC transporter permease n=1 Tax=Rhizobium sp. C4 TaxID=1349800 RepID=UPI001E32E6F4|nr:ABC transporter permease subunit [Rhizobium sp. C4]MCD2173423.1 ABC transporter permease subunit [Rhizobium sp. C4]
MMKALKGFALPVLLLVLWQIWATVAGIHSDTLAAPVDIAVAFVKGFSDGTILSATGMTLTAAAGGLLIGAGLGIVSGFVFGLLPPLSRLSRVTVEVLRPVPAVAILPIALLVFGFGYAMEMAIIAFACFFPVMLLTESAIRQITPRLMEVARVMRLTATQRTFKIVFPAVLPRLFLALRLAAGIALIVSVTVEISANPQGLGYSLMMAGQSLRPADMFAILFWIGLIGWALNWVLVRTELKLFPFHALRRAAE